HDEILSCMEPIDLIRYSQSGSLQNGLVKDYIRREFILDPLLEPFITTAEIPTFRKIQSGTHFLISGSVALQFFSRIRYPNCDLDIYVQHLRAHALLLWLESIGYTIEKPSDSAKAKSNMSGVYTEDAVIIHVFTLSRDGRQIQVICTRHTPLQCILGFALTCVMNFVTETTAYSLYPWATFVEKRALAFGDAKKSTKLRRKYASRGWNILEFVDQDIQSNKNSDFYIDIKYGTKRYVGDDHCWII
ncbi:hypothetical protein BDN72DRAFT_735553, partial [Pluteus cervinus]